VFVTVHPIRVAMVSQRDIDKPINIFRITDMSTDNTGYNTIEWTNGQLKIIDQTMLPGREVHTYLGSSGQVWDAIKKLKVRGAPAIGIAGAYGLYLGIKDLPERSYSSFIVEVQRIADYLNSSRPTAVNLAWALHRITDTLHAHKEKPVSELKEIVLRTAITIHEEDRRLCKAIGEHGVDIVPKNAKVLTHCNTGGLATAQFGTAFSVIWHAHRAGKVQQVWVDETRPLLQGSRLTAWELQKAEIPFNLIIDSAAAFVMKQGLVDVVVVGADRITSNGDTANKIGTYGLSVLCKEHGIPFYVAAPYSTIDMSLSSGDDIPIEERDSDEIAEFGQKRTAPKKVECYNPAFDITPGANITGIITEKGIIRPDYSNNLKASFSN